MSIERILWFDERVRAGERPGSGTLAAHFGVSARTARRDIEFLRVRLQAPLRYDAAAKGYEYGESAFYLPSAFFRKAEMIALLFARSFFRAAKPPLKEETAEISGRLDELFRGTSLETVADAVSFDVGGAEMSDKVFFDLLRAITQRRIVRLHVSSASGTDADAREIEPLKLHFSRDEWRLAGVSRRRKGIWTCPVSRIRRVEVSARTFVPTKKVLGAGAGARAGIRGGKVRSARIRFGPGRAAWASGQAWHPDQRLQMELDGSVVLELPEARFLEILGLILRLGKDASVVAPRDLREAVRAEIDRLVALYPEKEERGRRTRAPGPRATEERPGEDTDPA